MGIPAVVLAVASGFMQELLTKVQVALGCRFSSLNHGSRGAVDIKYNISTMIDASSVACPERGAESPYGPSMGEPVSKTKKRQNKKQNGTD